MIKVDLTKEKMCICITDDYFFKS